MGSEKFPLPKSITRNMKLINFSILLGLALAKPKTSRSTGIYEQKEPLRNVIYGCIYSRCLHNFSQECNQCGSECNMEPTCLRENCLNSERCAHEDDNFLGFVMCRNECFIHVKEQAEAQEQLWQELGSKD